MKKKLYRLPRSLQDNDKFDKLCQLLNVRYQIGVRAVLRNGTRRPGEAYVIEMGAAIFACPFAKCRPSWLVNEETGARLELDGYNQERGLAIEYQSGIHHRICDMTFYLERYKQKMCRSKGILLLEIWPEIHSRRVLLQFFEVMRELKMIPSYPTLWYGCWINSVAQKEIFSHVWLTYRGAGSARC